MTSEMKVSVSSFVELGKLVEPMKAAQADPARPQVQQHDAAIQERVDAENRAFLQNQMNELRAREEEVANLQSRLERDKGQIERQVEQLDKLKRDLPELRVELRVERARINEKSKSVAEAEKKVEKREESLEKRESKLRRTEQSVERAKVSARNLRSSLKAAIAEKETLAKNLRSVNQRTSRLEKENAKLAGSAIAIQQAESLFRWILENGGTEFAAPWDEVVVIGSGPVDEDDFCNFMIDRGMDVYEADTEGVRIMIVGRSGWTEDMLEKQIAAQEDDELRVYSQEMALAVLCSGSDILEKADDETLVELAGDHPALQFLRESDLQWPMTVVSELPREFTPFGEEGRGVDVSPIKSLGYTVGKTNGLSVDHRKRLLERAFTGSLPRVHSDDYMKEWGRPGTRRRLWRMAHHLAWLAKGRKNVPSHAQAVDDWAHDLRMLEKQFFRPWMRFAWPQVLVPGAKRPIRKKRAKKR